MRAKKHNLTRCFKSMQEMRGMLEIVNLLIS
nr:hypothetical protein BHCLPEHB_00127 [Escherichia coli]